MAHRQALIARDVYFYIFLLYLRRSRCEGTDGANIKHETARPDYKLIIFNEQPWRVQEKQHFLSVFAQVLSKLSL